VVINGYYKNGLKDSIWNEYYWKGKKLKTKGNYTQDLKVGVWEFYNYEAKLQQKYDFTKKELLFNIDDNKINDKKYKVINGTDTTEVVLEREPLYIGGDAMMYYSISRIIRYPRAARENGTSGKVFIAFIIDVNGKTSDHRVERGIGSGCDEEALKVVKEMPDTWIPGIMNGQKVVVEMLTPISFVFR